MGDKLVVQAIFPLHVIKSFFCNAASLDRKVPLVRALYGAKNLNGMVPLSVSYLCPDQAGPYLCFKYCLAEFIMFRYSAFYSRHDPLPFLALLLGELWSSPCFSIQ